jgi:hypothetical protein
MNSSELVILVSSFDRYAVCWQPFWHGLEKYWPGHPKTLFISNTLDAPSGFTLRVGPDRGWAGNLLYALDQIDAEFILYSQEDYWIQTPVDPQLITDYLGLLQAGRADYVRLYPAPPPDFAFPGDERLGIISPGSAYRTSLQMAMWRKSTLRKLLDLTDSPWQFEVKGSRRSENLGERFLCVTKRKYGIDYVFTAIVNGCWSKLAYEYAEKENIFINYDALQKKPLLGQSFDAVRGTVYKLKKKLLHMIKIHQPGKTR